MVVRYRRILETRLPRLLWSLGIIFVSCVVLLILMAWFFASHPNIQWNDLSLLSRMPCLFTFTLLMISGLELVICYQY